MFRTKVMLVASLALLLLILVIQNSEVVTLTFLFWSFEMSRVIVILVATMTGFIGGYLVAGLSWARPGSS